jgi:hypothetical protein
MISSRCSVCGRDVTADQVFRITESGVGHVQCLTHTDSQAGEPQNGDGCLRPANKEQVNGER